VEVVAVPSNELSVLERLRAAEAARRQREQGLGLGEAFSEFATNMTGVGGADYNAQRKRIADDTVGAQERELAAMEADQQIADRRAKIEAMARAEAEAASPADDFDRAIFGKLLPPGTDMNTVPRKRLYGALPVLSELAEQARANQPKGGLSPELAYRMGRDQRMDQRHEEELNAKRAERAEAMATPSGQARDPESAKKFRDFQLQSNAFRSAIEGMKALRDRKGFEVLDRGAVAQGKQLAAEARIAWKNMASLGVLSATDVAMMDSVIPPDPLGAGTNDAYTAQFDGLLGRLDQAEQAHEGAFLRGGQGDRRPAGSFPTPSGPQTVVQNGITYTLNPETGEYE
jgi:hypothetical protein